MTAKNLTSAARHLIDSYANTAQHVVNAYRLGNARVAGYLDQTWASAVDKAGSRLGAEVRQNALHAEKTVTTLWVRGITVGSDSAQQVLGRAKDLASRGVDQVAANAGRFEQATGITALSSLAQAAVPAASTVVQLAQRLESRAQVLAEKLAGGTASPAKRRVKSKAAAGATRTKAAKPAPTATRTTSATSAKRPARTRKAA